MSDLETAAREATEARQTLIATARALQDHIAPKRILDDALTSATARVVGILESAERAAKRRPAVVKYAGIGIGLIIVRKPVKRIFGRLFRRRKRPDDE